MARQYAAASPIRLFDRPGLAIARALEGNIGAAGRALVAPESLSPRERRSLVASLIGEDQVDSTYGKILGVITNPFVLLGAVLAVRYPVLSVAKMTKLVSRLGGYDRYVGPISTWVGSLSSTFRGTKIPGLFEGLARSINRHQFKYIGESETGLTTLLKRYAGTAGLEITEASGMRVFMKLDGLDLVAKGTPGHIMSRQLGVPYVVKPIQLNRAEQQLYTSLKQDWMPGHFTSIKAAGKDGLTRLREDGLALTTDALKAPRKIEHYAPHMLARRPAHELAPILRMNPRISKKVTTVHAKDRHNAMLPSREEMRTFDAASPGQLHPNLQRNLEREFTQRDARFRLNPEAHLSPKEYTMQLVPTLEKYSNSVARVHGWHGTPEKYGAAIAREEVIARAAGPHGIVKANQLRDMYIPMAKGQQTLNQSIKAAQWLSIKSDAVTRLNDPIMKKFVPETWRKKLINMLETSPKLASSTTAGAAMANLFYLSALGGNVRFAFANMSQTALTTIPVIGPRWTGRGIESVFSKLGRYTKLRGSGRSADSALAKAFPEYQEAGLANISGIFEGLGPEMDTIWRRGQTAAGISKVKDAMMAMMTGTEKFNRLVAFEGARLKALSEGVRGTAVLDFASGVMQQTQFAPTLSGIPYGLLGVNPSLKQFVTFGLKYTTHLAENVGGLLKGDPQRAGQLGRQLLTGGLLYEGGKRALGVDLSNVLMFGALPEPRHDSPLGVIPFTPPVVGLAASAVKSMLDADLEPLKRELPLLVPGGIAGARAIGTVGGRVLPQTVVRGISEFIGKEYADYGKPAADGRIPVYDAKGRLKNHYTGLQLLMRASGLPVGDMQQEAEFMGYILKQREQLRDYKRSWLDAYMNNDERKQAALEKDHKAQYGYDLPIKKSDLQRAEIRRSVPRLERMMKTLPVEARPQFGAILGTAFSSQSEGVFNPGP